MVLLPCERGVMVSPILEDPVPAVIRDAVRRCSIGQFAAFAPTMAFR
jgi:hypothetical protein